MIILVDLADYLTAMSPLTYAGLRTSFYRVTRC